MTYRPCSELLERPRAEIETDAHIEGNLATEVSFVILDTLEGIVQVKIVITFTAVMMMMMRLCSHIPSIAYF
jgi:nitrate reductase beta subunit